MSILKLKNKVFYGNLEAVKFLVEGGLILESRVFSCTPLPALDGSPISIMKITISVRGNKETVVYRCRKRGCQKVVSIFKDTIFERNKSGLATLLLALNLYIHNISNWASIDFLDISEKTYISYKKKFLECIKRILVYDRKKIGGVGKRVQVDETTITRGRLVLNPSTSLDEIANVVWLVGGVEEGDEKNFFLEIVCNRKIPTMVDCLGRNIETGTILISDGHPSYPRTANICGFSHVIVNHSEGFTNENGDHTNNIENMWSHLKTMMRGRHGIIYENWEEYIAEFIFRKKYLSDKSPSSVENVFIMLLKKIFYYGLKKYVGTKDK